MKNFLFVAAENDGIAACKAGGMADVVRDVPRHLVAKGDHVHVVVPSYGRLHQNGELQAKLDFRLRGGMTRALLYKVAPKKHFKGLFHYVIHHEEITEGGIAHIYHDDGDAPFYTDAIKYFTFAAALAQAIKQGEFGKVDIAHLHDWHTSMLLVLKEYHPDFTVLRNIHWVYSIHNLAIQGIRPFYDNYSSVGNFFPEMSFDSKKLLDKRYPDCINLMAVGIRLADKVHTVSPSYVEETLKPSHHPDFIGGEGLEEDLQEALAEGRYHGILNGVNYSNFRKATGGHLFYNLTKAIFVWLQDESKKYKADFLAFTGERILPYINGDIKPTFVVGSVARLTQQKFYFYKNSPEALEHILTRLKEVGGIYVLLGTGDPEYESFFRKMSQKHSSLIFVNGQSEDLIDSIYLETDLYLMPSQFEPCGISQMLAMRNGTPCLVHATGGLRDTVNHLDTGFSFGDTTYSGSIQALTTTFDETLRIFMEDKKLWKKIQKNAATKRFEWGIIIEQYHDLLY
ncbi:MAG: glycogen/starch synthase [Leeuwenhoekiella sp.]